MKLHLPHVVWKSLMAVMSVPGITMAAVDGGGNVYSQSDTYLYVSAAEPTAELSWDSVAGEPAVWDTDTTAAWVDADGGESTYTEGSHVLFDEGVEGASLNKSVQIAPEGVTAGTVDITGSNYRFSGGALTVTERVSASASAVVDTSLVIGGNTTVINVEQDSTLTLKCLETNSAVVNGHVVYESGAFIKEGSGRLLITDDVRGSISGATVSEGELVLASGVSMDVGANAVSGGTLENVAMLVTGEIYRAVSGGLATAHNIIKSADGENAAVLTNVTLHAGTSSEYATLQNVDFAGESTLRGYITFEETQRQRDMRVAAGGTLTVDNVCFDLHGLASGDKVLIENAAVSDAAGTLTGWETAHFVYSGITVNSAAVNTSVAGVVTIKDLHDGNLYWTGAADDKWNPGSANWCAQPDGTDSEVFTALSNVYFGADAANRDITVTQDLVVMNFGITDGGYSFRGGRIATLGDAAINTGAGDVTFHNLLVVQGNMTTSGTGSLELRSATTVAKDMTLGTDHIVIDGDVTVVGNFTVNSGSDTNAGSLDIYGNVTAKEMNIAVSAGEDVGNAYDNALVNVTGNLSVGESGNITIAGTAEQHYLGVVTAGHLKVNTQEHDVYFDNLQVKSLTVGSGAHVHVQTSSAASSLSTSSLPIINLFGTLALDAHGVTYDSGYRVNVQSDAASLFFGSGCTIDNVSIIGEKDDSGYTNVAIEVQSRSATVTEMHDLGNLTVELGSVTVKNAQGAVHGELILDNGKLKLGEGSDELMADDSGALRLMNGGHLDIGMTTQTLYTDNKVYLSGASSITGESDGGGLQLANGAYISYADAGNSIAAKMTVDQAVTLNSSSAGSSLEISGILSGSGTMQLTGPGTVEISGANTDFDGSVMVQQGSTLTLRSTDALVNAGVTLNTGATLALDAPGAVNINALTLHNGSSLAISSITGTDEFSALHAVLNTNQGVTFGDENVELNVIFSDKLVTMTTYNLMTGVTSIDNLSLNVTHDGVALDASQYKIGLDADTGLLYIYTLMGNVWESQYGGVWSTVQDDYSKCWSGGSYYDETGEYTAAIFGDLSGGDVACRIDVDGKVSPGDVYFVADSTEYIFEDPKYYPEGQLAAGTNIHKDGTGNVTLGLRGNQTSSAALGDMDIQAGTLRLVKNLAVQGAITVESDARLAVAYSVDGDLYSERVRLLMGAETTYTIGGMRGLDAQDNIIPKDAVLSGVTVDANGIRGEKGLPGRMEWAQIEGSAILSNLNLINSRINTENGQGNIELTNVTLSTTDDGKSQQNGYYQLYNVTIGKEVEVEATGRYYLSGNVTFKDTLINEGIVYLSNVKTVEIGQISYTFEIDDDGRSTYTYRFIDSQGEGRYDGYSRPGIDADRICINGIRLKDGPYGDCGLAEGIDYTYTDNKDGSVTLSIGNGTVGMPQWDERWGKMENAPGISRRYAETDPDTNLVIAEGNNDDADYYLYSSIVNEENADKVNEGKAISITLSSAANGNIAAAGCIEKGEAAFADHEVWIYDRSGFKTVIGGLANWSETPQSAATHILINTDARWMNQQKELVVGGSRWGWQYGESYVTVKDGNIKKLIGGSYEWVEQTGTAHVFVDGGEIGEIFAAGYLAVLHGTQVVDGRKRAVEMLLTGGTLGWENGRVFGGGDKGTVNGDIYIRMEQSENSILEIRSQLVGGANAGTVNGDIVLDLVSGKANRVDAAGLGWEGSNLQAYTNGNVLVNLYSDFQLSKGAGKGLYGGKELSNHVTFGEGYASTLNFAESGVYELGFIANDGYSGSADSVTVTGFDRITMADGAHAIVALSMFDTNMVNDGNKDSISPLSISGKGVVEVIGHGANFGRDILLTDGATLKVSTSVIGLTGAEDDRTITVTEGSSIDFSGFPVETQYQGDSDYAGLGFNVVISGHGANGMGALYKGKYESTLYPNDKDATSTIVNRIVLPNVVLTGSASVGVEAQEYLFMNADGLGQTQLDLARHTFTKLGAGDFIARSVEMKAGTVLVQQGAFGSDLEGHGAQTDMVLAAGTELKLDSTRLVVAGNTGLELRSLSGSGKVTLNGSTLTLHTDAGSTYYAEYMDETQAYDQFSGTTGFGYAVFSGLISDGSNRGKLAKTGYGVHYISGSSNTYTGGTQLQEGRLYLLGTGVASEFSKGVSKVASGVAGTGAIVWGSANAELYLGHDAHIYNEGTTNVAGGKMTIGVEGAPNGVLADFVGIHSKDGASVIMGGVEYVEIETHNLKSIAVNAYYADGTEYVAGTDIDRNKMLLVKKSDWDLVKNTAVTGFSDTGYNEAIYSGVLYDSNNVAAKLHKVGVGTLVLDQSNSYSGGTEIDAGTLRVRGWGSLGKNVKENTVTVQDGATLMFTHNGGYGGDEPREAANDITIDGRGDNRWVGNSATDGDTAALISAVGPAVTFTLSGDISGTGNVRHSGEGVLVLSGDSSYSGGTYVSRGTVEVQSATGLGDTASGQGAVTIERDADLRVTVETGYTGERMVTKLASESNDIQGDVTITGTADTERVLHMDGNGYKALSTTLNENGTLLVNGAATDGVAVTAESALLTGKGTVVVSDAAASGASATFDSMIDYNGDFRVEGDKASIKVNTGTFIEGSIHVAGQQASVSTGSDIYIVDGESLHLRSTGSASVPPAGGDAAPQQDSSAAVITGGALSVAAGAVLSVSNQSTEYEYNLSTLQETAAVQLSNVTLSPAADMPADVAYNAVGIEEGVYKGFFDTSIALNQQAAGSVQAADGLKLSGGATYDTVQSNICLMGGTLTLDTMEHSLLNFTSTFDGASEFGLGDSQLVLFSGVGGVYFGTDGIDAKADSGIYYTRADRYISNSDFIDENTLLVYDSYAEVVYLHNGMIPEPATATLSLLALAALAARRRRRA